VFSQPSRPAYTPWKVTRETFCIIPLIVYTKSMIPQRTSAIKWLLSRNTGVSSLARCCADPNISAEPSFSMRHQEHRLGDLLGGRHSPAKKLKATSTLDLVPQVPMYPSR
jgi:hypothetical protein